MNRIFKVIWNWTRSQFSVVAENKTSRGKGQNVSRVGKHLKNKKVSFFFDSGCLSILSKTLIYCFFITINTQSAANTVFNNDITTNNLPNDDGDRMTAIVEVHGNYTNTRSMMLGVTDQHYYYPNSSLYVYGNYTGNAGSLHVGHNRKSSGTSDSTLYVQGNMILNKDGIIAGAPGGGGHDGYIISTITVDGTTTIKAGAWISNDDGVRTTSTIKLNTLNLEGGFFRIDSTWGDSKTTIQNLNLNAGLFRTSASVTLRINGTAALNGGTFSNTNTLVIGPQEGKASVANLTLNGGTFTVGGLIQRANSFNVNSGNYTFASFTKSGGTLTNNGTLTFTQFNQTAGATVNNGTLTLTNPELGGTLSNTKTLNLNGTVSSNGNLTSTGTLNVNGTWTESKLFNVGGTFNNNGTTNFNGGFNLANATSLTSKGTLTTTRPSDVVGSFGEYRYIPLTIIDIAAQEVQEQTQHNSEHYKELTAGSLATDFANKAKITGGKVVVKNAKVSQEQIDQIKQTFKQKYANAELVFENTTLSGEHTGILNVDTVNKLYDENETFQDVTFVGNNLAGENKALTVGDSEGNLKHSTGFKGIENAESITVNDGKSLELVGEKGESSSFFMAAVKTVVNAASKLVLGSKGLSETYSGKTKEVQLAETNATLLAAAGIYEVEKISGKGKVEVDAGAKLVATGAEHSGELNVRGTLDVKNDASFGATSLASNSSLYNDHALHLSSLTSDNTSYYQTGGSLQTDSGWFSNSTLYVSGGKIDMSDIAGGSLSEEGLGNNRIFINGKGSNPVIKTEDPAEEKANWKDGLTLVKTEVLKSETSVTIEKGGVLQANKLQFDGVTENSVILAGGALETQLDQIFNDVNRDYLDIDAENLAGQEHKPTHVLGATSVGKIKDEVKTAIQGNSGIVVFNDEYVKMEGIVQAMQHFAAEASHPAEQDPEHPETASESGVYLAFTGQVDARLTVDLANKFDQEQEAAGVAGVVLSHTTLYNEQSGHDKATYRDLVIGYNEHEHPNSNVIDVESGIGFLSVEGADTVHVEEGKEFVLVGHHDDNEIRTDEQRQHVHSVPDSQLFNENTALIKNDKNDGGTVEVTGKFTFGSFAAHTNTVGWIGSIQIHEKGEVETKKGEFAVWNVENAGNIHVDAGTILHSHNYSGEGNWLNEGQIYLSDDHKEHSQLESQDFEIKGKFENAVGAIFSSEQKNNTIVENELDNKGVGLYSVLTVNGGGKSTNDGIETAESLIVNASGSHTIGTEGVSAFKKASVGGEVVNNGDLTLGKKLEADLEAMMMVEAMSLDGDTGFEVLEDGKFTNTKNLDARLIATSDIKGQLSNTGHALYSDMVVGEHGSSITSNYEKGEWLTVHGSHSNSAVSIWNKLHVKSKGNEENSGQQQLTEEFVVEGGGNYTNTETGELDATQVPTTEVSGNLVNKGKAWYDDMVIHEHGLSENSGYEQGDIKTVESGGTHTNSGTSIWNELDVAGDFNNSGSTATKKFTIEDGGLAQVGGGRLDADEFVGNGGDLVVGNDQPLAKENRVQVELGTDGDIDTNIYVKNNGDLGLGKGALDFADGLPAKGVPEVSSRLVVTGPVTTGKGGGIAVGPDVWTDKDHHVDVNNGDLYFANGSYTVVDSNEASKGSMFNTRSDNAKVTVEEGATLVLGDLYLPGDYYIVEGFKTAGNEDAEGWAGGWVPDENLLIEPKNDFEWTLSLEHDDDSIWVHATTDVRSGMPDIALPNNVNDDMNNWCKKGGAADARFVCGVITDPNLSMDEKQRVLNSVANLPTIGGAMTVAMQAVNNAFGSAEGRASMLSDVFDENGDYKTHDTLGNSLWIDLFGGWNRAKGLQSTGMTSDYKSHYEGFAMGYDHVFAKTNLLAGVAFSYENGKLDSKGEALPVSNKFNSFGLQTYAGWHPSEHFNLIATSGLFYSQSKMNQGLGGIGGFNKAQANAKTALATSAIRAEIPVRVRETGRIVPHVGFRLIAGKTASYWTKLDGEKAFHNKPKTTVSAQIPIGVSYREDFIFDNGWIVKPKADFSIIPQLGNKQRTTVIGATNGVKDLIRGEFSGQVGAAVNIGVQADKDNVTVGLNYGLTVGDRSRRDHALKVEARWRF